MKKSIITLTCLVSAFSLLGGLTACGDTPSVTPGSTENPGTTEEKPGTSDDFPDLPDVKEVKIEFWHTFGQGIQNVLNRKVKQFHDLVKENEGVDVTVKHSYKGAYKDIVNVIGQGFAAGNVPQIAVAYPDHVADYLHREPAGEDGKFVVNLEKLMKSPVGFGKEEYLGDTKGANDFVEAFFDEGTHYAKPGTYSLPLMKSSEVLFYNNDAVTRALRLKDPNSDMTPKNFLKDITWDEFIEFNKFCYENKEQILTTLERPLFYDSDSNLFITKLFQNNIDYSSIDENGKGVIGFEKEPHLTNAKNEVKAIKKLYEEGILTTKGIEGTYSSEAFLNGRCMFVVGSSGGAGYNMPTSDDFKPGIVKVPYDNAPLYVTQGPMLTMLRNTKYSDEVNAAKTLYAWKFIKFLLTPDNNVELCIAGSEGYIPVRESCFETEAYLKFLREGEGFAETAKVLLQDINGAYLNTAVFPGSAQLRKSAEGIVVQSCKAGPDADGKKVDDIFMNGIANARVAIN